MLAFDRDALLAQQNAALQRFGVRLELPNPAGNIPAGIKCRVAFD